MADTKDSAQRAAERKPKYHELPKIERKQICQRDEARQMRRDKARERKRARL